MEDDSILHRAIEHYGAEHQKIKAIEEMSELMIELAREHCNRTTNDKIVEEIADVMIMAEQLSIIYGREYVQQFKTAKLQRIEQRINND